MYVLICALHQKNVSVSVVWSQMRGFEFLERMPPTQLPLKCRTHDTFMVFFRMFGDLGEAEICGQGYFTLFIYLKRCLLMRKKDLTFSCTPLEVSQI